MKALFVDDDPQFRMQVEQVLTARSHSVTVCTDADQAWQTYEREMYPLVILDWKLPGKDGLELCRKIRATPRGGRSVIVVVTDREDTEDFERVLAAGADDYMSKPIDLKRLQARISIAERNVRELVHRHLAEGQMLELTSQVEHQSRMLEEILTASPNHIYLFSSAGVVLYASRAAAEALGRGRHEIVGRTWQGLGIPADVAAAVDAKREAVCESGWSASGEIEFPTARGTRSLEYLLTPLPGLDGEVELIVCTAWDITERKQNEEALRRSERYFRSLIENALDIITILGEDGAIRYESPSIERVAGYAPETLVGRPFVDLVHHDDYESVRRVYDAASSENRVVGPIEFRFRHRNNSWLTMEAVGSNFSDDPVVAGIVLNSRDATERKRLEAQILRVQKMESLGVLAGGIAHDFKNVLAAIRGFTELGLRDADEQSDVRRHLEATMGAVSRATELVGKILTFSRQNQQKRELVRVADVTLETLSLIGAVAGDRIEIRSTITDQTGLILADATQLHQVVMNLCTNALHAMQTDGGVLDVSLQLVRVIPGFDMRYVGLLPGPYLELVVRDSGHGIPSETLERVFDPFFTTKEIGEGTGMGLAMVHGIIDSFGGMITVDSEVDKGTVFKVYLPCTAEALLDGDLQEPPNARNRECILVVDDEPLVGETQQQLLGQLGYEVVTAQSGREALDVFRRESARVDLVLTDQFMPSMTGAELIGELQRMDATVPVIVAAGSAFEVEQLSGIGQEPVAVLIKPVVISDLAKAVRKALDTRL